MVALLRTHATLAGVPAGDDCLFTMNWQPGTGGGSVADATDCLARFRAMWAVLGAKIATGGTILFDPFCEVFDSATGDLTGAFSGTMPANVVCAGGSSPLPAQTQGLIAWHTGIIRNGRFLSGRTFVPLPDEGDNDASGSPSSSYTSQLNAAVTALLTAGTTASVPVVWGRPTTPGGSNGASGQITSGAARNYWASQRKRR